MQQQADAVLNQANPVSNTLYTVMPLSASVRLIHLWAAITWGVTQPTPLEFVVTIDGQTLTASKANPTTGSFYEPRYFDANTGDILMDGSQSQLEPTILLEGRLILVQERITWAVTQPSPLFGRVKYAKW